jgi:ABC-type nitrate/sulfonate/bicarbonate transport system substrate-binding protein
MKHLVVCLSAVVLCCLQAAAQPATGPSAARLAAPVADFPRPEKLTIGYLPVIYHAQVFGAQEQGWLDELGVKHIEFLRFPSGTPFLQAIAARQVDIGYISMADLLCLGHGMIQIQ